MERPTLLLTAKKNKDNICLIEILNRILIKDMNATAVEIVKNVIILYSNLNPMEAYGLLISGPPSCVAKIFPIHGIIDSISEAEVIRKSVDLCKNVLKNTFYVQCYSRGVKVNCREIEIGIGIGLKGITKVDFKSPELIVFVNVVRDKSYISLLKKGGEKVSVKSLGQNI
ncbi:RNA methyltransferase [Sulfolobus acidocaldarius SUSAZ]|nr:RNA methyltransferase [Sulfolobus acidocaldarius SUSAZ]